LLMNLNLPPALAQATANMMQTAQKASGQTPAIAAAAATAASVATSAAAAPNAALTPTTASAGPITGAAPSAGGGAGSEPLGLTQSDDLLAIPGYTPQIMAKLKEFIVVLPTVTPLNVNTASAEVLSAVITALPYGEASALVARRTYFNNVADFTSKLPNQVSAGGNAIDVKTGYFLVNGKVRLSRAALDVQSLIQRTGSNTSIVWTRQN